MWKEAGKEYNRILASQPELKQHKGAMTLPAVALYRVLTARGEDAEGLLNSYGEAMGRRFARMIHALTSLPGADRLVWRHVGGVMEKASSEKLGYKRELVSEPPDMYGVDILTTLSALAAVCLLSLAFILIIPHFAATKVLMSFLPRDIREAAKAHPDPSFGKQMIGYLITALAAAGYIGLLFFLGADGLRRSYGFWLLFCRYMLFLYGYKLFDILVQDQYIVITRKYFVKFYPETRGCKSWDDRSFNTKNQMIRLIAFPFVSALMAWITLIIGR